MRQQTKQNQTATKTECVFEVARIFRVADNNYLKAFVDINICNVILIKGIRLLANKEGGLFVSMPSQKGKDEKYFDIVRIIDEAAKNELQDVILEAYKS